MADLSATDALAALKAALDRGEELAPEDKKLLVSLQADTAEIPDELLITLRKPVRVGGEKGVAYTELRLREPTAGEMMSWDKLDGREAEIMAVSVVSGLPRSAVELIGARDLNQAARYIGRFLA